MSKPKTLDQLAAKAAKRCYITQGTELWDYFILAFKHGYWACQRRNRPT